MPDHATAATSQASPPDLNPDAARTQLHAIIDRLPDAVAVALWRLLWWWAYGPRRSG